MVNPWNLCYNRKGHHPSYFCFLVPAYSIKNRQENGVNPLYYDTEKWGIKWFIIEFLPKLTRNPDYSIVKISAEALITLKL